MISTQVLKLLVKYGADIDAVCEDEDIPTVEAHADMALGHPLPHQFDWSWHYWCRLPGVVEGTLAFFRDYRAAGGTWKRYVVEPRKQLLVLRRLVERGRARPPRRGWTSLALLRDYRAAGGTWRRYVTEPRKRLLVLRRLVERGRAAPPDGTLARVQGLPDVLFWKVLAFWRSDRDV